MAKEASDSENEFVDATDYFEYDSVPNSDSTRKGRRSRPTSPRTTSPEPVAPPRGKKKTMDNKMSSSSSPVVSNNQMSGQDHVTMDQDHVTKDQDHVTSGDDHVKDHVTSGEDCVISDEYHMISDKDHVILEKDHVTTRQDHVISGKDHVTTEQDHVISNKKHMTVEMATKLDHTSTNDTVASHDTKDKAHDHHGDVIDHTDGGSNYDATKELDEILSKCDLVDGSHLSTNHSIGMTDTKETRPPQQASHEQPQDNPKLNKKSNSLEVPSTSAGNKSPSPGPMSDSQILDQIMVKNLDTGEVVSLKVAEQQIPQGFNPLSLHLMHRTSEFVSGSPTSDKLASNSVSELPEASGYHDSIGSPKRRRRGMTKRFKHLFGRSPANQKTVDGKDGDAVAMESSIAYKDDSPTEPNTQPQLKYKQSSHYKGTVDFDDVRLKQDLAESQRDAIWAMRFSVCGRLLATAGQDKTLYVWVLRSAYGFFFDLQSKYARLGTHPSYDSLSSSSNSQPTSNSLVDKDLPEPDPSKPFCELPICEYKGHKADILDICWSKNFFLLSASMDKTVRLWHVSRKECLCCFQHVDFVTAIAFHPRDDRYFLSGSLDGKLRLWNIPDKKVALWNEIGDGSTLITAANFCQNGKKAVVGTYDGRCLFFDTEHLKYHTQIHVRSRRGKNSHGSKISGIEPLPGEDKLLITSNDSRVRLYNLRDLTLACKYKGCVNTSSQIKACFSHDGRYVICGSEDHYVYIWKTFPEVTKFPAARRDRNESYESFTAHNSVVTAAVFAPVPGFFAGEGLKDVGQVLVAADYSGAIKVYVNGSEL